jgi:CO/xanthine dehydrogenase Mo-binding subunit
LPPGRARGIAVHESFNTFVAQVAEIAQRGDAFRVERVVCAVDCGVAVNPNIVSMQMESGIGYGLSAALAGAITLKDGVVEQSNFHDYPILRINEMPRIEVHVVPSREKPTGVGEPATPVIVPALANALYAATGRAVRSRRPRSSSPDCRNRARVRAAPIVRTGGRHRRESAIYRATACAYSPRRRGRAARPRTGDSP